MRYGRLLIEAAAGLQDGLPDAYKAEAQIYTEQIVQGCRRLSITMHAPQPCGLIAQLLARSRQPSFQW
jgi:hypothetical protein